MEHLNLDDLIWENEDDTVINGVVDPMLKELCLLAGCLIMVPYGKCPSQEDPPKYTSGQHGIEEACGC